MQRNGNNLQPPRTRGALPLSIPCVFVCCLVMVVVVQGTAAYAGGIHRPFRCFRPFDALDSFSPSAMHNEDNCIFDFVRVRRADVGLECIGDAAGNLTSSTDTAGCYATLSVDFATTMRRLEEHRLPEDAAMEAISGGRAHYHPHYTLELRAVNHSTVAYKGFDGMGYDVCCDLLNSSGASCSWGGDADDRGAKRATRHVVDYCALLDPNTPSGTVLHGSVRKPLHRVIAGAWEYKLVLYRGQQVVGRVVVPFTVTQAHLEATMQGTEEVHTDAAPAHGSAVSAVVAAAPAQCGAPHDDKDGQRGDACGNAEPTAQR